jgi:predicted transcriptional regulator
MTLPVAKDIMKTDVITVNLDMSVHELANLFIQKMISGAPVVDKKEHLIGIVSMTDIVKSDGFRTTLVENEWLEDDVAKGWEGKMDPQDLQKLHLEKLDDVSVRDIMTTVVYTAAENTPVTELARLMLQGHIHRLIITRNYKVVGIVTTMDMLKVIQDHFSEK